VVSPDRLREGVLNPPAKNSNGVSWRSIEGREEGDGKGVGEEAGEDVEDAPERRDGEDLVEVGRLVGPVAVLLRDCERGWRKMDQREGRVNTEDWSRTTRTTYATREVQWVNFRRQCLHSREDEGRRRTISVLLSATRSITLKNSPIVPGRVPCIIAYPRPVSLNASPRRSEAISCSFS
jgi:hypothetical protein